MEKEISKMNKSELIALIKETYEKCKELNEMYNNLKKLTEEQNEDGTIENRIRTYDERLTSLKEELPNYETKHDELYKKIETELNAGATTVKLTKSFDDRYKEYKGSRKWKDGFLVILFLSVPIYWISKYGNLSLEQLAEIPYTAILKNIPIFSFVTWAIIVLLNKRAEDKKIEEMYNHKAAMAQSYVGYEKHIEGLEKNLGQDNKNLLSEHMKNLLNAINSNPSDVLSSKGEGHSGTDHGEGKT